MAWWLTPMSPERPTTFPAPPRPTLPEGTPENLPTGIQNVVSVDPQNILLITGTAEAMATLENKIRFLDKPLRQVEILARFLQVAPNNVEKLGLHLSPTPSLSNLSRVTGNIDALLASLLTQKKVTLLASPRLVAINNLAATLGSQTHISTMVRLEAPNTDVPKEIQLLVASSHSLEIIPTINNDDTVTVAIDVERGVNLEGTQGAGSIVLDSQKVIHTTINFRDGETVALEEEQAPDAHHRSAPKFILLLTTRLIRRAGE